MKRQRFRCVQMAKTFPPLELKQANEWVTLSGKFKATGSQAELAVVSHVSASMGNDFRIKELKIKG